ncbi:MAG: hypothetical protein RRA92_08235, partial [Gemmatimonadota bacterium]|nr:hypothetical protein [Gemmatimonadota bacterium]
MKYRRRRGLGGRIAWRPGKAGGDDADDGSRDAPAGRRMPAPGRWIIVVAVVVGLFFAGYLAGGMAFGSRGAGIDAGPLVEVPELVGLADAEARERVEAAGLAYGVRSSVPHPRAPEGAVLAQ